MKHTASVLVSSDFIRSHLDSAAKLVYLAMQAGLIHLAWQLYH